MAPEDLDGNTHEEEGKNEETHPDIDALLSNTEEDEALPTDGIEVKESSKSYRVSGDGKVVTVPDWGGGPVEKRSGKEQENVPLDEYEVVDADTGETILRTKETAAEALQKADTRPNQEEAERMMSHLEDHFEERSSQNEEDLSKIEDHLTQERDEFLEKRDEKLKTEKELYEQYFETEEHTPENITYEIQDSPESETQEKVKEEPSFENINYIETSKGSRYTYLPDGTVERFKTATGEKQRPQDAIVFIPNYDQLKKWVEANKGHLPEGYFNAWQDQPGLYMSDLLEHVQFKDRYIDIVDQAGARLKTNKDIQNAEGQIFLAFGTYDKNIKEGEDGSKVMVPSFYVPVSKMPKLGYNTYDESTVRNEEKGTVKKYRHIGHEVTNIVEKENSRAPEQAVAEEGQENAPSKYTVELDNHLIHEEGSVEEVGKEPVSSIESALDAKLREAETNASWEQGKEAFEEGKQIAEEATPKPEDGIEVTEHPENAVEEIEIGSENSEATPDTNADNSIEWEFEKAENTTEMVKRSFETLGISEADVQSIEGFNDLTEGQQLLVAENLKQLTLGRIQEEAHDELKKETSESRFLGRVWKNMTKLYQTAKYEKKAGQELLRGGLETHGDLLRQLTAEAKEGPGVKVLTNGELQMEYLSGLEGLTEEQKETVEHFNAMAHAFSKIPDEWGYKTAGKREKTQYETAKKAYENAKTEITWLHFQKSNNEQLSAESISKVDETIQMNRFLNTHKDAESALKSIKDDGLWKAALKNMEQTAGQRALYSGVGFAGRAALTGALGVVAAPIVAGSLGGFRGYKRAKGSLEERDTLARRGVRDESAEARNVAEAESLKDKLESLALRMNEAEDDETKKKVTASLLARIDYTERKMHDGLVNFGDSKEKLSNQVDLLKALSFGKTALEGAGNGDRNLELEKRLQNLLELRDEKIDSKRKRYIVKQVALGAGIGAAYAYLGGEIRRAGEEFGWWGHHGAEAASALPKQGADAPETAAEAGAPGHEMVQPEVPAATAGNEVIHTVEKGENLWNIIKEDLERSGSLDGLDETARLQAIDAVKDKFELASPEQLRELGIGSGNAQLIQPGEKIDLGAVYASMDKSFTPSPEGATASQIAAEAAADPYREPIEGVDVEPLKPTALESLSDTPPAPSTVTDVHEAAVADTLSSHTTPDVSEETVGQPEPQPNIPQTPHEEAVAEALGQKNVASPLADEEPRFRVANYEAVAQKSGPLPPEAAAELTPDYLKAHELSQEQYLHLHKQYGRAVDQKMKEIFDSTRGERKLLSQERQNSHEVAREVAKARKGFFQRTLGGFGKTEVGRDIIRESGHPAPSIDTRHGFRYEWEGNPRSGQVGIKDYQVSELFKKRFLNSNDLNYIERNNRSQLLSYIKELQGVTEPGKNETVEEFVLRATAVRNGGGTPQDT